MTKSVTDNSNSSGASSIVQPPTFFTPSQIKPNLFESRTELFFFYPGMMCLIVTCVL